MKLTITPAELQELTTYQKEQLRSLWQPQIYDLALASICIDVENDKYQHLEMVVGDIAVHQNYHDYTILLRDLKTMGASTSTPESDQQRGDIGSEPETALVFEDEDLIAGPQYEEYNKEECLPLLSIGQMIALIQKKNYGDSYFYLTVPTVADYICSIGRDGCTADYEQAELCDVLWECLKAKL